MLKLKFVICIFASVVTLIVYTFTLAPTVWFIDSGELAAVASNLGIAHPTGYPLFTLVGHLFTLLPFSSSEIYKLNFMSAFFCALGIFMFGLLINFLFTLSNSGKGTKQTANEKTTIIPEIIRYSAILFSCFALAFSSTYWSTGNSVEVYSIHVFFLITLMFVFIKAISKSNSAADETNFFSANKYFLFFAFLLGLSFTNHMTTILLAPACLTLFIVNSLKNKQNIYKLLVFMALAFVLGLSLYLYLPLRASMQPDFLWGNPYNFERFKWHITGKQFSVWLFSAPGSVQTFLILIGVTITLSAVGLMKSATLNKLYHFGVFIVLLIMSFLVLYNSSQIVTKQFMFFVSSIKNEFGLGIILLAIPGIYYLSKNDLKLFYFFVLTFFGCLFYSVNYDIYDIASYFLLAYITLAVFIGYGIFHFVKSYPGLFKEKISCYLTAAIILALSIIPLSSNFNENDESKNYYVEEMTMNIFNNVEPNGIVISSQWDFWLSASWYYNFVKKVRPDIVVIDKELLRRSWYFIYLERHYPEVYNNARKEIEIFLAELNKFEFGIPYDQKTIMKAFQDMLTSFVVNNPNRKSYMSWEITQNTQEVFAPDYAKIPDGILIRLVDSKKIQNNIPEDYKLHDFNFTVTKKKNYYHETLMLTYSRMLFESASYLNTINRKEDAKKYLALSLKANPDFPQAKQLKNTLGF